MRRLSVASLLAALALLPTVVAAQATPPATTSPAGSGGLERTPTAASKPAPRLADGKPDLSGVWQGGGPVGDLEQGLAKGETIPLLPEAKKIMEARQSKDDPEANCLPTGVPRIAPYPWRIVQTPTHVFFLFEGNIHSYRQIFMNGKHPEDPDPTWFGHSTGKWEGDTLVVDTVGYNEAFWMDRRGMPHTNQLHTIERFTRTSLQQIRLDVTVDDPGAYTAPWSSGLNLAWNAGDELFEYICQQSNYAGELMVGEMNSVDRSSPIVP